MQIKSFSGKALVKKQLPFLLTGAGPSRGDIIEIKMSPVEDAESYQIVSLDIIHKNYKICMHVHYDMITECLQFLNKPAAKLLYKS